MQQLIPEHAASHVANAVVIIAIVLSVIFMSFVW